MNVEECDYDKLALDEACVVLNTVIEDYNATLYSLSSDCISCPYNKVSWIQSERNISTIIDTAKPLTWRIYNGFRIEDFIPSSNQSDVICQFEPNLGEYGIYKLIIDNEGCKFDAVVEPSNRYTPLIIILGVVIFLLFGFALARIGLKSLKKKWKKEKKVDESYAKETSVKKRVLSIDTFRGISIVLMIFANNGSGGYAFLDHATWNGLLVIDLIFPCFVWIMGVCIPISLSSQLSRGISRSSITRGIVKRSFLLFLIGVSLNTIGSDGNLKTLRIFGVLQRFGVAYLVVSLLYTFLSKRKEEKYHNPTLAKIADFLYLLPQWIIVLIIMAIHCIITFTLPVPGCPTGYLGPGGRHADGIYFNCTGGAAGYIDNMILGKDHVYQRPLIAAVYGSGPFDPEGILGCLTTILQTFLGVQAGKTLRIHKDWIDRIGRWLLLALLCGGIGAALHFFGTIPINKNLWSLSFVLTSTSFALALLTAFYLLVDVTATWNGGPFRIPGMNALVMFVGHHVCSEIFPFHWKYGDMNTHTWRTISALWQVTAWTIVAYILHRKRIYITL